MDHKTRLIVAENDPLIAWAVRFGLMDLGYEVCAWADTAPDAVRLAELHRPDVAVVDGGLSDRNEGIDAAREISGRLGIPVVICRGNAIDEVIGTGHDASAPAGWVAKPYRISDLDRLIAAAARH
ncbi:response regulator [Skermanella mucosa]|uniref:response regulator n=1 Tax=Skermanella mucosa TaxID=1789672 RepID=UPI00192AFAB4|nr:response regulator [Skermanella mucosa]UEM20308.1 response regulator [Skermanella mucosa]